MSRQYMGVQRLHDHAYLQISVDDGHSVLCCLLAVCPQGLDCEDREMGRECNVTTR